MLELCQAIRSTMLPQQRQRPQSHTHAVVCHAVTLRYSCAICCGIVSNVQGISHVVLRRIKLNDGRPRGTSFAFSSVRHQGSAQPAQTRKPTNADEQLAIDAARGGGHRTS